MYVSPLLKALEAERPLMHLMQRVLAIGASRHPNMPRGKPPVAEGSLLLPKKTNSDIPPLLCRDSEETCRERSYQQLKLATETHI